MKTNNPFEILKAMGVAKLDVTRSAEGPDAGIVVNDQNGDLVCRYQKIDADGFCLRSYVVGEKYSKAINERFEAISHTRTPSAEESFVRALRDSLYQHSEAASESGLHKVREDKKDNFQRYAQAICDDDFAQEIGLPRPPGVTRIRSAHTIYTLPAAIPT